MTVHDSLRRSYARRVTADAGCTDGRVEDAFAHVKRESFVGRGPWQIPGEGGYRTSETDDPAILYQDTTIGLAPELGINNGQPSLHAICLCAVEVGRGEVVIHVGAGTGYYTAILAELAGPTGRVHAYEISPLLAHRAALNLATYQGVTVLESSALAATLPTADVIYVSAGVTGVPSSWLAALSPRGRLVLPLTPNQGPGFMLLIARRRENEYAARSLSPAYFIPCVGAREAAESDAVAAALRAHSPDDIRSFRLGDEPDDSAWCVGNGWWLSTR
jgi:protein-L-isoaspartate(D-aspartate) O-methyltransferase